MKVRVTLKDPDCLQECIEDAVRAEVAKIPWLDELEQQALVESRTEKVRKQLVEHWFRCGEYLTVEIDTELETAVVVARKAGG